MATYTGGNWTKFSLDTNQRRTNNDPYGREDFVEDFPAKEPSEFEQFFPVAAGGFNFITNADGLCRLVSWCRTRSK